MPGMAISSWPSRKLASRVLIAANMGRFAPRNTSERGSGVRPPPRRNVTVSRRASRLMSGGRNRRTAAMRLASALALCAAAVVPAAAGPLAVPAPAVALLDGWRQPDGSRARGDRDPPRARLAHLLARARRGRHPAQLRLVGLDATSPSVAYEWPRPAVFDSFGLRTFGYAGSLVLPVLLTPEGPGRRRSTSRSTSPSASAPTSACPPRPALDRAPRARRPGRRPRPHRGGARRARRGAPPRPGSRASPARSRPSPAATS